MRERGGALNAQHLEILQNPLVFACFLLDVRREIRGERSGRRAVMRERFAPSDLQQRNRRAQDPVVRDEIIDVQLGQTRVANELERCPGQLRLDQLQPEAK